MPLKTFEQHLAEQYPTAEDKNRLEAAGRELDAAYMLMKAREEAGLTQQEVAEKAHIARATVNRIERGIVSPTLETYNAIAQALGKHVAIHLV